MRIYFNTNADCIKSPSARLWFYQMCDNLLERNIHADLNEMGPVPYDIAIIHWARSDAIQQVLKHSPNAHIGVLNPGPLGLGLKKSIANKLKSKSELQSVLKKTDFFIVTSFVWRDLLLPYGKRIYLTIDYEKPEVRSVKQHSEDNNLIIGYHGSPNHFKNDFFPYGANALKRLAREFNLTLHVVTRKVHKQPSIKGIPTRYIEFDLSIFHDEIQKFDIGLCPALSACTDLSDPLKYIRNPNRVNTLLFYGIPSVTSPIPQACHDLCDGETALFAVTEEGWYQALRKLIVNPDLRNRIGNAGRKMVEKRFSEKAATDLFLKMLDDELKQPVCQK